MRKLIKDGQVAVLYSPGYGAGWSTWNRDEDNMLFDPGMVDLTESGDREKMEAYATLRWPNAYLGGLSGLKVAWLPVGTLFRVTEYDGAEGIETRDSLDWHLA